MTSWLNKEAAMSRIEWVVGSCRLLGAISDAFDSSQPFAGSGSGPASTSNPRRLPS